MQYHQTLFQQLEPHKKKFMWIMLLSAMLLAIAYLTHLGTLPIDPRTDETRRALVSLEMMASGDYLAPTLNGEPYLNKPPLYNWIIIGSYKLFGITPFALRFPVIVFTFCYSFIIFYYLRKHWNVFAAAIVAMFFATNGRILIYDSLQGLIDVCYSMLIFWSFMLTWQFGEHKQWWKLFVSTWLLAAIGFLMKGLPSIVFQAIALGGYFLLLKKWWWKPLFSLAHFAAIGLFVLIAGGYYLLYFNHVDVTPAVFFNNMLHENSSRTFVNSSPLSFIIHFVTYPFTLIYHFAPWALLLIVIIRKDFFSRLKASAFILFIAICFAGGLAIYWLSPNIMARYLFMILPLMYAVCMYIYNNIYPGAWQVKFFEKLMLVVLLLLSIACLVLPFIPVTAKLPFSLLKGILLCVCLLGVTWLAYRQPVLRFAYFVLALVITRFGFNWFVIENRGSYQRQQLQHAKNIVAIAGNKPVRLQRKADLGNWDGLSYYYLLQTDSILRFTDVLIPGDILVTDSATANTFRNKELYAWPGHIQQNMRLVEVIP